MHKFTVIGGSGFIGSAIIKKLKEKGYDVDVPGRRDSSIYSNKLGNVIYCAGSGDCLNAPYNVFEANLNYLSDVLFNCNFDNLLYVSSTRVYLDNDLGLENSELTLRDDDSRRLFNLTKLTAEELCLRSNKKIIIVRPSNVYGLALNSSLFLPVITKNALTKGVVDMYVSPDYAKDYVSVDDVSESIITLSLNENSIGKIINIAAGYNVKAKEISKILEDNTKCEIHWHDQSSQPETYPLINIEVLKDIIPEYKPRVMLDDLSGIIQEFKDILKVVA